MKRAHRYTRLVLLTALLVAGLAVVAGPVAAQDEGEIDLTIEPNSSVLEPGEVQTYEVIVEGADSGISAYDEVVIDLSDSSVGTIVDFEEQFDEDDGFTSSNSEIRNGGATLYLEAITGTSFANPADEVVVTTFDLEADPGANDGDTTDIEFDSSADQVVADFDTVAPYDVAAFGAANMTVDIDFGPILEIGSVDAPDWIQITDDLEVEYTIENVGDATGVESAVELVVDITGPTVEDADTDVTVDPGEPVTGTLVFDDVGSLAPGATIDYTVQLVDYDDNVSGTANITEGESEASISNLDIAGQGTNATIVEGQEEAVGLEITNIGSLSDEFFVELTVYDENFVPVVEAEQSTAELGPADSEAVVFEGVTDTLEPGEYSVQFVAGGNDGDHDSASGDLTVEEGEPISALSNLDIAGQGTDATIVEGTAEPITVDITNVGQESGQFEVTLDFYTEDGERVGGQQEVTTDTLAPDESATIVFEAATDHLDPGEYVPEVTTSDDGVSGGLTVEAMDEPESLLSNLDIAGQGSTATIVEGEDADVTLEVENVGEETGTFDVTLDISTVLGDPAGEYERTTDPLAPGESETVVFEAVTGDLDPHEYAVELTTADDELSGELSVEDEDGSESPVSNVDIAGQGSTATVIEGASVDVTVDVANTLSVGETFDVTLHIGDTTVATETTGLLLPGQSETVTFVDVTVDLETGQYDVVASTAEDQATGSMTVATGVDVTGDGNLATDTLGDGLLNDIDGDETFDIFDVQALFNNLDNEVVQTYPGLFNFNDDDNPTDVTVFDVQGLFGQLQAAP